MINQYLKSTILISLAVLLLLLLNFCGYLPFNWFLFGLLLVLTLIAAIFSPRITFWCLVAFLPFENIIISPDLIPFSVRPYQLLGASLLSVGLFSILFSFIIPDRVASGSFWAKRLAKNGSFWLKRWKNLTKLDTLVLVLVLIAFASTYWSLNQSLSLKLAIIFTSFAWIFLLVRIYIQSGKELAQGLYFFLISSFWVISAGFYQSLANKMGWQSLQIMTGRINSTFTEPDWLALYLAFVFALLLWLRRLAAIFGQEKMIGYFRADRLFWWLGNSALLFVILAMLLTVARSGWLAMLAVLMVYGLFLVGKRKFRFLGQEILSIGIIGVLALTLVYVFNLSNFHLGNRAASSFSGLQKITVSCKKQVALPEKIDALAQLGEYGCRHINLEEIVQEREKGFFVSTVLRPDPNVVVRKNIYQQTWQGIKSNFWLGQGLGTIGLLLGEDENQHRLNASNIFLEVWFAFGFLGLLVFTVILLLPFLKALPAFWQSNSNGNWQLLVALSTVAILVPNLFNAGLMLGFFWFYLAVITREV